MYVETTTAWGFQPTNVTSTELSGYLFKHVTLPLNETVSDHPKHGISIGEIITKSEQNPRRIAALQRARIRLSKKLSDNSDFSLATLRLKKGMSQAALAKKMNVSQPYIAKIERGEEDFQMSTIEKIAAALEIFPVEVFQALSKEKNQ